MRKVLTYDIDELAPYVNWIYFHFAWGMDGKPNAEKEDLRQEALAMLTAWQGVYHAKAVFRLMEANSDGDDLVLGGTRLPLLRQQRPSHEGAPCLCLADFVRPLSSGKKDKVGLFCATMGNSVMEIREGDDYKKMMAQTLSDRLAEAAAERMHEEVRRHYWGYAPAERLTMEEIHAGHYQGIRPAVGYPSLPDTSVNFILQELLNINEIGVRLSESGMMVPHASVSGLMIAHPQAHYFELGRIGEDQLRDYARRRGIPVETARRFLQSSLIKR
ncbi:MAG: vitamin B12 dependent-methionine synthase activation domain-containing protein [Prevotella sp.]|nr:vitamin B12 dependent-methionine synthase activation domain-containing protein [Prevotella sp.]